MRSGACVQDSLPASLHFILGLSAARLYHRLARLAWSSPSSLLVLPPHPHPQQPPPPTPSQPAGGDAALLQITQIQTRFICSASDLIGHRALKKSLLCFFLLCMFPHSSSRATSDVRVCVRVCIVTLKAARAPLFQMTLFTDTTQPPRIPRQNLISREHHDSGVSAEREIQVTNYGTFFNYVEILLHQCCNRAGN